MSSAAQQQKPIDSEMVRQEELLRQKGLDKKKQPLVKKEQKPVVFDSANHELQKLHRKP